MDVLLQAADVVWRAERGGRDRMKVAQSFGRKACDFISA